MKINLFAATWWAAFVIFLSSSEFNGCDREGNGGRPSSLTPDGDNGTLTLPAGFGAITVSAQTGKARHIAVNTNGDVYVKLSELKNGNGILVLKDANNDGRADSETGFANYTGTGIAIKNGFLYASSDSQVFRYALPANGTVTNSSTPDRIVTGLAVGKAHKSKSITLDNNNNIYVNIGAPSNACQVEDRKPGSPAQDPCLCWKPRVVSGDFTLIKLTRFKVP